MINKNRIFNTNKLKFDGKKYDKIILLSTFTARIISSGSVLRASTGVQGISLRTVSHIFLFMPLYKINVISIFYPANFFSLVLLKKVSWVIFELP